MKNALKTLLAVAAIGAASSASAVIYDASVDGTTNPAGSFVVGGAGTGLVTFDLYGYSHLGVTGGSAGNEIGTNESLTINFDEALRFGQLTLGLLYNGPEFHDLREIAVATLSGEVYSYTLQVDEQPSTTGATWLYNGGAVAGASVVNLSPSSNGGTAGVYQILNPFGSKLVTSVTLTAATNGGENDSDFTVVSFEVPDSGATLALLGLGLGAISIAARRRR